MSNLEKTNRHERDSLLFFNEIKHSYSTLKSASLKSVSNVISSQFKQFDADDIILKMRSSYNWSESKYYGMDDLHIKKMWKLNGKEAREAGTILHLQIEQYCNGDEFEAEEDDVALDQFISWDTSRDWKPYRTELENI